MARLDDPASLSALARLGFDELSTAGQALAELSTLLECDRATLLDGMTAADPDAAVQGMLRVARRDATGLRVLAASAEHRRTLWRVFGASPGLADFFLRHPSELSVLGDVGRSLPTAAELTRRML